MFHLTRAPVATFLLVFTLFFVGCDEKGLKADLSTPEGAILLLEEAYREGNIEKAVSCKDFKLQAAHLARSQPWAKDESTLAQLAKTLEVAYRAELKKGVPDLQGVESTFIEKKEIGEGQVVVTEISRRPNGNVSTQKLLVAKGRDGWKVLLPVE
jgi:hypothetical protein